MNQMFKSALAKLTLWYVAFAITLSLLFSVVIYHFAAIELREGLNSQFRELRLNDTDASVNISHYEYVERTNDLFSILVYFNLLVLVLSFIASYLLARRTLKPIEDVHRSQTKFIAQASHELRTPIAAMMADTESILDINEKDPKVLKKTLRANMADLKRLNDLANHLLEIASIRSTKPSAAIQFKLDESIRKIVKEAKRTMPSSVSIKSQLIPTEINGDPISIELAISTVLDNAVKYGGEEAKIQIKLSQARNKALVVIEDNGPGIPPEELPNIYKPFHRSEKVSGAVPGHGIGLTLAKEIIDSHNGSIEVRSNYGEGTTVYISLPC